MDIHHSISISNAETFLSWKQEMKIRVTFLMWSPFHGICGVKQRVKNVAMNNGHIPAMPA